MHCGQCGNELDLRYRMANGDVQCRYCGAVMPAAYVNQYAQQTYVQPQPEPQPQPQPQQWSRPQPEPQPWRPDPAPAPVVSTGRRVIGIFSLILGLLSLFSTIFAIIICWHYGPSVFVIPVIMSVITVVLGAVGKGGCHVAGLVIGIISLVFSLGFFIVLGFIDGFFSGGSLEHLFRFDYIEDIIRYGL